MRLRPASTSNCPTRSAYGEGVVAAVTRGDIPEALVDRAARRLLTQKAELGLLDADWTPEASVRDAAGIDLDSPENRAIARRLAERSIILLDAGTALPLLGADRPQLARVAVVGPCAADPQTFLGCYSFPNHVLPAFVETDLGIEIPSAVDALRAELPDVEVVHQPGCSVTGTDRSGFAPAVEAARDADLCIAFVGDRAGLFGRGTSGEGCDVEDLRLPGVQADLLDALLDAGTPVVVVVVSGRPYALGDVAGRAAAMVQAFMPGEEGGPAIAGVLSGRISPGGKLPVQIPRHPGGQPRTYLQPPLGSAESAGISSVDPTPLSPSASAGPTPRSRSTTCASVPPRCPPTASSQCRSAYATPAVAPELRSCSFTCTTSSRRSPGRSSSSPDSHGSRSSRARPWTSVSAYMPTAWHIPTAISSGSWNQET